MFGEEWYKLHYYTSVIAKKQIDFILSYTKISQSAKVYDFCCGFGRHSNYLALLGYQVVGIDTSEYLLDKAKNVAKLRNIDSNVCYINDDIRTFRSEPSELVINMFNSIGYMEPRENLLAIENLCFHVKKGGY